MPVMIIETAAQLHAFCDAARTEPALFVDTEFVGEGRYYPDLGAIQIATRTQAVLIDPLALPDLAPLHPLLIDPSIEKVFHAATQDLAIFYRILGQPVAPVFDTQIAAALLGYDEQISFANLVERTTHTHLHKSHGFTDWLRRPLSPGQLEYALDDVRYLVPVYDTLVRELDMRGRLAWAHEEFLRFTTPERFAPADPDELYLRIRGVERMGGQALAHLRALVAWREETARAQNIPTGRIARDEVLIEIARRPRQRVNELKDIRGITPPQIDRFGEGMLEAVRQAGNTPPPVPRRQPSLSPSMEPTVDFLVLCLRSLAADLHISPGVVATRGDLTALVMAGERADTPLMRGWRRAAIGDALLATLRGQATARILPGNRQVHLEWHETPPTA